MITRQTLTAVLLGAAVMTPATAAHAKAPSAKVIKKQLKQRYEGFERDDLPSITKLKVTVGSFKRGKSRIGSYYHDGTPPHTKTRVYPIRLSKAHAVACNQYFANDDTYKNGTFVFFKDEFGKWTYRGVDDKIVHKSPTTCPI